MRVSLVLVATLAVAACGPEPVVDDGLQAQSYATTFANRRHGPVRACGSALCDGDGPFMGLGASLFWAPWAYKFDRAKLERNLAFLARQGFQYIRVFGQVGCPGGDAMGSAGPTCPDGRRNYWNGRVISIDWPDYDQVIAGLTDLAYDKYGLRVEWTVFASYDWVPSSQRFPLLDRFLAMSRGREEKIMHFEIANEGGWTGFTYFDADGLTKIRDLTRYLNDRTAILVGATHVGTEDDFCHAAEPVYAGGIADIFIEHYPRDYSEDGWRPVRASWDTCGYPLVSSNEPIGPGSSGASENDPYRLVANAVTASISGIGLWVYHTEAGVWGGLYTDEGGHSGTGTGKSNVDEYPQSTSFAAMLRYLPPDLSSWQRKNIPWAGYPFEVTGETTHGGTIRAYATTRNGEFWVNPIAIRRYDMRAKLDMQVDVLEPLTGAVLSNLCLRNGEAFTLTGLPTYVLHGHADSGCAPHGAGSTISAAPSSPPPPARADVELRTDDGSYVTAVGGGGGEVVARDPMAAPGSVFQLIDGNGGEPEDGDVVSLQAQSGQWLVAEGGGGRELRADRDSVGVWEQFTVTRLPAASADAAPRLLLRAHLGQYVNVVGGALHAEAAIPQSAAVLTVTAPACSASDQVWPHWAERGGACLRSCGALGGTTAATTPCAGLGLQDVGAAYDVDYCCAAGPVCDPTTQPAPHWGEKNGVCLPSCGAVGGTYASDVPCSEVGMTTAGDAYDVAYCCAGGPVCDPATQPAPHWGEKNGVCLGSCGAIGGTYASDVPCSEVGMSSAGEAYDVDYCCR